MSLRELFSQKTAKTAPKETPGGPWAGDMLPRETGPGEPIERTSRGGGYSRSASVRLEWVSRETDGEGVPVRVRTPAGRSVTMPEKAFMAAGKPYVSRDQLTAVQREGSPWAKDVYGRDVLVLTERFPCFDSSDLLYEKRRFRWYFLCRDGALTCVYHMDKTAAVTVTEDVLDLERQCWKEMKKYGCFEETGDVE